VEEGGADKRKGKGELSSRRKKEEESVGREKTIVEIASRLDQRKKKTAIRGCRPTTWMERGGEKAGKRKEFARAGAEHRAVLPLFSKRA